MSTSVSVPAVRIVFETLGSEPDVADALISPLRGVWIAGLTIGPDGEIGYPDALSLDSSRVHEFGTWLREQRARWQAGLAPVALEQDDEPRIIDTRFPVNDLADLVVETELSNGITLRLFYSSEEEPPDGFDLASPDVVSFETNEVRHKLLGDAYRAYAASHQSEDSGDSAALEDEETDPPAPSIVTEWQRLSEPFANSGAASLPEIATEWQRVSDAISRRLTDPAVTTRHHKREGLEDDQPSSLPEFALPCGKEDAGRR